MNNSAEVGDLHSPIMEDGKSDDGLNFVVGDKIPVRTIGLFGESPFKETETHDTSYTE